MEAVGGGGGRPEDRAAEDRHRRIRRYMMRFYTALFFASLYLLTQRWREKDRAFATTRAPSPSEIAGAVSLIASLLYLLPHLGDI